MLGIFKIGLLILVLGICTSIGILKAKSYDNRVIELKKIKNALGVLKSKIEFTYEPIKDIFLEISKIVLAILADYFIWYFRSKASVARGGACKKVHTQARLMGGWVLIGALALCLAGTLSEVLKPGMAIVMAY